MMKNRIVLFYSNRADEALIDPLLPRLTRAGFQARKSCFFDPIQLNAIRDDFDFGVIAADRWQMALLAPWLWNHGFPFAHIDAGELSSGGTYDDINRWAITRYAHLIFTNSDIARKRVIRSGEEPKRVFNVGYIAFDDIELVGKKFLCNKYKIPEDFDVLMVHPDPTSMANTFNDIKTGLEMVDKFTIILQPNNDRNSEETRKLQKRIGNDNSVLFLEKFDTRNEFLSALKYCKRLIGNSSCNTFEAKYLGVKNIIPIGKRNSTRRAEGRFGPGAADKIVSVLKQKFLNSPILMKSVRL